MTLLATAATISSVQNILEGTAVVLVGTSACAVPSTHAEARRKGMQRAHHTGLGALGQLTDSCNRASKSREQDTAQLK